MKSKSISTISIFFLFLVLGIFLVSCGTTTSTPASSGGSTLDGQTLMQQRCSVCHSLDRVTSAQKTLDQWTVSVNRMIAHGAQLSPQEEQTLVAYLAANYK
jgi:mono/diheme cytochrome c family protein